MRLGVSFIPNALRILVIGLLVFLLISCGANSTSNSKLTSSPTDATQGADASWLHIQPQGQVDCPWQPSDVGLSNNLALASKGLTYNENELQQMRAYWGDGLRQLPATLRWVSGGPQCGGIWEVTNTGNATIQISRVTLRLTKTPLINSSQYHLVDVCTLVPPPACLGQHGNGPSGCSPYYAIFYLQAGRVDDTFSATPVSPACGELTLEPNDTIELLSMFYPASGSPGNLIYSVVPELVLSISGVQHTLMLPQLGSTLTFAIASQLGCYELRGTTFVMEKPQPPANSKVHWCINLYVNFMPH
jgi:hypothetical protein